MRQAKSFSISKEEVFEAYKQVKRNRGAAGVDHQTLVDFETQLEDNLYKLWNRLSSGSYFPPPVQRVEIPKEGGTRLLGIPTVADRIAQTVVKNRLEPELEKHFHPDSYGYRPGKSAIKAVGVARERCWRYAWVVDVDISTFFDSINHELMLKALRHHTEVKWIVLYVERWLKAPVKLAQGTLEERTQGTPQGGVISPVLANLFLHYAFDRWMQGQFPKVPFERYADDVLCHCTTEEEAEEVLGALEKRLARCYLKLNLQKTQIVYCKRDGRGKDYPRQKFDFLGFTFRPRITKGRFGIFIGFNPAVSKRAKRKMNQRIKSWNLHLKSSSKLEDLAKTCNSVVRGWWNYYGSFCPSELNEVARQLDLRLGKWAEWKYKRLKGHSGKAIQWVRGIKKREPQLFAHWGRCPKMTGL
jgi:RNA-directed DNA polymerase